MTAATTCTVTGLTNGTAYTFTVTASSTAGPGTPSAPSAPVTPRTVPGAPIGVTASAGDRAATITWSPPADDGGSVITGYRVTTVPASVGCEVTTTACAITGLVNGQEYAVTVVAVNAEGTSAPSTAVTVRPREPSSILITGTRTERDPRIVRIRGEVRNLDAAEVQPFFRLGNQRDFQPAMNPAPVVDDAFTWQRSASRRITVYVKAGAVESNRVTIRAR